MVFEKGDIVAVERCGREICCCSYLDQAVAAADVTLPVIVSERDLKREPALDLAALAVEVDDGEGFAVVGLPDLVVGSIFAAVVAVGN